MLSKSALATSTKVDASSNIKDLKGIDETQKTERKKKL